MTLIILGEELPRSYSVEMSVEALMWVSATITTLMIVFTMSILIAANRGHTIDIAESKLEKMQEEMLFDRYSMDRFYSYADSMFAEYAKQAGILQARMARLETLGSRLANMADFTEFDFTTPPALGGPEDYQASDVGQVDVVALAKDWKKHLQQRQDELSAIETLLADKQLHKDSYVSGKPIRTGWLTSGFGKRIDPFTGRLAMHKGVDYTNKEGTDIHAVASGVVSRSELNGSYGRMVEIDHGNGLVTRYGHNKVNLVKVGDVVSKGQVIAKMGSTGRSTGNHVHFEVLKQGRAVDPIQYIYRKEL